MLLFDLARVILLPQDLSYQGELNSLHKRLSGGKDYDFSRHFELDYELLSFLDDLKEKFILAIYTSGKIQDAPEIKNRLLQTFSRLYSAIDLGISKKDPAGYTRISGNLGVQPSDILFIDDTLENITAAKYAGFQTHLYTGLGNLKKVLESRS